MTQSDTDKYTVPQAARCLSVSLKWVRDMIYADRLPAQKIAGRWYIRKADLESRLKQRREA
jgi:excisionase family DNA binding protein